MAENWQVRRRDFSHLTHSARETWISYTRRHQWSRVRLSEESRMNFVERTNPNRKFRGMGHPSSVGWGCPE